MEREQKPKPMVIFIQGYVNVCCTNVMLYELIGNMKKNLSEPLEGSCWEAQLILYDGKTLGFPKKSFITQGYKDILLN